MNWLNYAYKYAHTSMRIKWILATTHFNAPLTFNIQHKHNVRATIKHCPAPPDWWHVADICSDVWHLTSECHSCHQKIHENMPFMCSVHISRLESSLSCFVSLSQLSSMTKLNHGPIRRPVWVCSPIEFDRGRESLNTMESLSILWCLLMCARCVSQPPGVTKWPYVTNVTMMAASR